MNDQTGITGVVSLAVHNPDGSLAESRVIPNLIMKAARDALMARFNGLGTNPGPVTSQRIAVGTEQFPAPTATDTGLITVVASQTTVTVTQPTTNSTQLVAIFAAGTATGNIADCGLFNTHASLAEYLAARTTFTPVTVGAGQSLTVTWLITAA